MAAAAARAYVVPCCSDSTRQPATSAAPQAWPVRRAVATMPLAPPARSRGALPMIAFMFGAWNRPKPIPHTAMGHAMANGVGASGIHSSASMPAHRINRPIPASSPDS